MASSMCRVCLNIHLRMRRIDSTLQQLFENVSGTKLGMDTRDSMLCYICSSQLQRCLKFYNMAQRADRISKDLAEKGFEITRETVAMFHLGISQTLSVSTTQFLFLKEQSDDDINSVPDNVKTYEGYDEIKIKIEKEDGPGTENADSLYNDKYDETINSNGDSLETEEYHDDTVPSDKLFICDVCQKELYNKQTLIKHIKNHEKYISRRKTKTNINSPRRRLNAAEKPYSCNVCHNSFIYKSSLKRHFIKKHSEIKMQVHTAQKPIERNHVCSFCHISFTNKSNLIVHMRIHTGEKPFSCDRCGKKFRSQSKLNTHMFSHGEKTYSCDICGKKFRVKYTLKQHINLFHGSGTNLPECDVCGKKFTMKSSLEIHKLTHSGKATNFCCDNCGQKYKSKFGFDRHIKLHRSEKLQVCDTCGKKFSNTFSLERHKIIHTGEKPYICDKCGKKFPTKGRLSTHMISHAERAFTCSICEKKFTRNHILKQHIKSIHKNLLKSMF